ncbi:hypothetical protein NpPPO83_00012378 [Neofusicoccum parvum]|uniref:Uncharacterized protein n=1 Tax=Neofusicoccum parvum TaxID=310453 RepID=A0ACB5RNK1_9PEZI|nr:hypothetical protein NpPPO83_00012378 [Neofusicoccum parvum]
MPPASFSQLLQSLLSKVGLLRASEDPDKPPGRPASSQSVDAPAAAPAGRCSRRTTLSALDRIKTHATHVTPDDPPLCPRDVATRVEDEE